MTGLPGERPLVSVVVPMFDEKGAIEECLDGFAAQTYPLDRLEVLVVDGGSTDGSRQIVDDRAAACPWLRVVDNPARRIPVACNLGIGAARGDIVCFFSSHGVPTPTYVERTVAVLGETGADGVGGTYVHEGQDPVSRAIGLAMSSPYGMASPHRFATSRREVDTASHPAYRIGSVRAIGGFDERLERNEDYDLNWRLRRAGGRIVFDPTIRSTYRPRRSLGALTRQFWWYGWWKARVLSKDRGALRLRHVVPPLAVAVAALAPLALTRRSGRVLVGAGAAAYGLLVSAAVTRESGTGAPVDRRTLAVAFPAMHLAWGGGFLVSLLDAARRRRS